MLETILDILKQGWENEITRVFIIVIVLVFIIGLVPYFRKLIGSGTLTSLGILGTFVGISLALMEFDPAVDKAQKSIEIMIRSMETAFISSLVGISAGIVHGFLHKLFYGGIFIGKQQAADTTLSTLNETLVAMQKSLNTYLPQVKNSMDAVKDAISGDGDSSIHTQMGKLRMTNQDGFNDLQKSFTDFAEKVSELGTKAIIQALEEVIRDFNNNLTEQFGENFKQLNAAVERLVDWQDKYRQHVKTLTKEFKTAQKGIATTTEQLTNIANEAEKIPPTVDSLSTLIQGANEKIDELEQRLSAFAEMKQQATDAFPIIQQNLKSMTTGLKTHIETLSGDLQQTVQTVSESFTNAQSTLTETTEEFNRSLQENSQNTYDTIATTAQTTIDNVAATTQTVIDNMDANADVINTNAENMIRTISSGFDETQSKFKETTDQFNKSLTEKADTTYESIADTAQKAVTDVRNSTDKIVTSMQNGTDTIKTHTDNMVQTISTHAQNTVESVKTNTDALISQSEKLIKNTESQITDALNRCVQGLQNTTTESLATLNENMQQVVQQQIDSMGNSLTAVVEKFIEQYEQAQNTDYL